MKKNISKKSLLIALVFPIILLQSSCEKTAVTKEDPEPAEKATEILYRITNIDSTNELWSVNADGTNKHKINITLPTDLEITYEDVAEVTSDGKLIVFLVQNKTTYDYSVYKCNIDGSSVTKIVGPITSSIAIQALIDNTSILYWKGSGFPDYNLELWAVNIDGTNDHKINITLPTGLKLTEQELAKVTTDGKTIAFLTENTTNGAVAIYKCNIDGSGVTLVTNETLSNDLAIQSISEDNDILYRKMGTTLLYELWSVNINGTNNHKINISLAANLELQNEEMGKSKGGILYFSTLNTQSDVEAIYTSKADGSSVKLVTEEITNLSIAIQDLY